MKYDQIISVGQRRPLPMALGAAMDSEENTAKLMVDLEMAGISISPSKAKALFNAYVADALEALQTTVSITTPLQFLQAFMPGFIQVITQARRIDDLAPVMTVGSWESEEIVVGIKELANSAVSYTDHGNTPIASFNSNFERRTVVRRELGASSMALEEARTAAIQLSAINESRNSAALGLEIDRNSIGFYGFNSGNDRTYGLLNDPNLGAYKSISAAWSSGSYDDITKSILAMVSALRVQGGDNIDFQRDVTILAIATSVFDRLNVQNSLGSRSVRGWINETFPKMELHSIPQFDAANSGANVAYLYVPKVAPDGSSDGGESIIQLVPIRNRLVGVEKRAKGVVEVYSSALAGVIVKRPWAVVRYTGL